MLINSLKLLKAQESVYYSLQFIINKMVHSNDTFCLNKRKQTICFYYFFISTNLTAMSYSIQPTIIAH